jgi:hypothetical protein
MEWSVGRSWGGKTVRGCAVADEFHHTLGRGFGKSALRPGARGVLEAAKPVRQQILALLENGKISYSVALVAMSKVMLEIAITGLGMEEGKARAVLASFFVLDEQKH